MKSTLCTITAQPDGEDMTQLRPQRTLRDAKAICQQYQNEWDDLQPNEETRNTIEWTEVNLDWWECSNFNDTQIFYTIAEWKLEMEVRIE